jgi:hypothetical protein
MPSCGYPQRDTRSGRSGRKQGSHPRTRRPRPIGRAIINHDDFGIRMALVGKSTQTFFEKSLAIPINNDNADFVIVFSRDHPCQVEAEPCLSVSYAIFARYSFKPSIRQPLDLFLRRSGGPAKGFGTNVANLSVCLVSSRKSAFSVPNARSA